MINFSKFKLDDLDQQELCALRSYKAASSTENGRDIYELNRDLRNGLFVNELPEDLRSIADGLDRVFDRCPKLDQAVTVYRGVGWVGNIPFSDIGKKFRSLEYWSTTTIKDNCEKFLISPTNKSPTGAIMKLQIPIGFPVYNMETLFDFGGHEMEILLPRATVWEVKEADLYPEDEVPKFVRGKFDKVIRATLEAQI
jgi:hypothetical protein